MTEIADWQIFEKETTDSTNNDALNFPFKQKDKIVFIAERQTAGRGRLGRKWYDGNGNLMFSLLFCSQDLNRGMLSLACGICVLETIECFSKSLNLQLKWPNDVLVDDKKVCGILIENRDENSIVVGIGVNLKNYPLLENAAYKATALSQYGINVDRFDFLKLFLLKFNQKLAQLEKKEFNNIKKIWLSHAKGINTVLKIDNFGKKITGVFAGIGNNGELVLKTKQGTENIIAGDVLYNEE